jgi:TRAP-type C4-dicarboxylate transport system permease small subunit
MYQVLGRILSTLNFGASVLTLAIMVLIGVDVFGRALFGRPLYGVPEITKLSIVCLVWLQMAYTLHVRKHLRADTLLGIMPSAGRRVVMLANGIGGVFVFSVIASYGYFELARAWSTGTFEGEDPVRLPIWPVWLILVVGAALTALEYLVQSAQAAGFGGYREEGGSDAERGEVASPEKV